jgi:hypothetical protein
MFLSSSTTELGCVLLLLLPLRAFLIALYTVRQVRICRIQCVPAFALFLSLRLSQKSKTHHLPSTDFPAHTFPSIIGRPILRAEERGHSAETAAIKDIMVGDLASEYRSYLQLTQPMEHGIVKNWDDMKILWDYTFQEKLRVDPAGRKILLTEPPMNPVKNREKMAEVMFEEYGFGGVYVAIQAVLTLYAQGAFTFRIFGISNSPFPVRRSSNRCCRRLWRWCHPHRPCLRRLRPSSPHQASRRRRPRCYSLPHQAPSHARLRL